MLQNFNIFTPSVIMMMMMRNDVIVPIAFWLLFICDIASIYAAVCAATKKCNGGTLIFVRERFFSLSLSEFCN
jgi:hypothetical protein